MKIIIDRFYKGDNIGYRDDNNNTYFLELMIDGTWGVFNWTHKATVVITNFIKYTPSFTQAMTDFVKVAEKENWSFIVKSENQKKHWETVLKLKNKVTNKGVKEL